MFRKTLPILVLYLVTILFSVYYGLYDKDITIDYSSSIISTNLMVVLLCTVTLIVALWLVYKLLQKVLTSPLALWNSFVNGRKTKDFELLANALALAAVKEYDDAKLLTEEVDA
ncbi:MAG: hypothetical protein J0G32_05185, partial [Alphaproteobacteria bacterium]|nr:hypothetical protein [Alphaproteobacteria bacterium]